MTEEEIGDLIEEEARAAFGEAFPEIDRVLIALTAADVAQRVLSRMKEIQG